MQRVLIHNTLKAQGNPQPEPRTYIQIKYQLTKGIRRHLLLAKSVRILIKTEILSGLCKFNGLQENREQKEIKPFLIPSKAALQTCLLQNNPINGIPELIIILNSIINLM